MTAVSSLLVKHGALFVAALVATVLLTPVAIRIALRVGLVDRPAERKFHRKATPYLGGFGISVSVLATMVGVIFVRPNVRAEFVAILLGAAAAATIGLIDDWLVLGAAPRLTIQALSGLGLWAVGIRFTPTGVPPLDLLLTVLAVMTVMNAVNLIDNMDGVCAGTVAVSSFFLFVLAYPRAQNMTSALACAVVGACLGFLVFNFNPARIFLGDAGTLFLGFLLATMVMRINLFGYPPITRVMVPLLVLAVPLFDTTLVIVSRIRRGKPVYYGGTDHTSHRLVLLGASPRIAALTIYAAGAITGAVALVLVETRSEVLSWALLAVSAAVGVAAIVFLELVYGRAAQARRVEAAAGGGGASRAEPATPPVPARSPLFRDAKFR